MPAAHRKGDNCTGHGCWPTRQNIEASEDVFVNDIGWHREDDKWDTHCCAIFCHDGVLEEGSSTVFVNGKGAARVDDPVDCGSKCLDGSEDVFAGG